MATRSIPELGCGEPLPGHIEDVDLAVCAWMRQVRPAPTCTDSHCSTRPPVWARPCTRKRLTQIGRDVCALAFLLHDALRAQLDTPTPEGLDQANLTMRDYLRGSLDGVEVLSAAALVSVLAMTEVLDMRVESHNDTAPDAKGQDHMIVLGVAHVYAMRQAFGESAWLVPAFAADKN